MLRVFLFFFFYTNLPKLYTTRKEKNTHRSSVITEGKSKEDVHGSKEEKRPAKNYLQGAAAFLRHCAQHPHQVLRADVNIRKCPHKLHFSTVKDWRNPYNQTDIRSKTNSARCHILHTRSLDCLVDRAQSTVRGIGDFPQGLWGAAEITLHPLRKGMVLQERFRGLSLLFQTF